MSKVIIVGYYGEKNTGDDAFLAVASWWCARHLDHEKIVATMKSSMKFNDCNIIPLYSPPLRGCSRLFEWIHAGRAQSIIFAGGSNFHSTRILRRFLTMVNRAQPGPHFAVGVSIGPFADEAAAKICGELLSKLSFVGVRDRVSLERARAIAPETRIELTFDIAPLLRLTGKLDTSIAAPQRRGLGIMLCNNNELTKSAIQNPKGWVATFSEAVKDKVRSGLIDELVLIDFNGHPRFSDAPLHRALKEILSPYVSIRHFGYNPNPLQVMEVVAGLRGVVAMRLHAAVFAYATHTPTLIMAYHEKCREWAEMTGVPRQLVLDVDKMTDQTIQQGLHFLLHNFPVASLPVEEGLKRAEGNWNWLEGNDI